jgi:hypothetical protein
MRRIFRVMRDRTGNLPSLPAVFPDTMAPVVRTASDGGRELVMMRWGFPAPPNIGTAPVTNVRNLKSPYWRSWLKAEWRCLVPATKTQIKYDRRGALGLCGQKFSNYAFVAHLDRLAHSVAATFHDNPTGREHCFHCGSAGNENPCVEPFIALAP